MKHYDIFLSHSSNDKEKVRTLAKDLQEAGLTVWLDEWEICVGDSITQKIQSGLSTSTYIAIWLTQHAVTSGWVQKEWQTKFGVEVQEGNVAVLPLLIG